MKLAKRTISFVLAAVLLLSCVNLGAITASAVTLDTYIASCTTYASNMSIRTTASAQVMTYPCTTATESSSSVSKTVASGTRLTATALYLNTAGEYWYKVGSNQYINAANTTLVEHLVSDLQLDNAISPACVGYGKGFYIGGTVSASINQLGTVTVSMYTGTDLTQTPAMTASDTPTGQSYTLDSSTIDNNLPFSSLPKADYTYVVMAEAIGYYVNNGVLTKSTTTAILEEKKCIINGSVDASGATAFGIDVSVWQGDIDWSQASKEVDFAIFRSSYSTTTDSQFYNNLNGCVTYGVPFGIYFYSYAYTAEEAREEAEYALSLVKGYDLAFPIFFDMEEADQASLSNSTKLAMFKAFAEVIKEGGYEPGIYSAVSWYNSYYTDPFYDTLFKWVAQIYSSCQYTGGTRMWQYSWEGSISGISGDVDCNYYYGEFPTKTSNGGTVKKTEPQAYRWETVEDTLVSTTNGPSVYNNPTLMTGSISGGVHNSTQYKLEKTVMLNHDDPWSVEWKSTGNEYSVELLASSGDSTTAGYRYLYHRSSSTLIALGAYLDGQFHNYGLAPSDYGIDCNDTHIYRLENRINADGSNMVYLLIDGKELGAMNGHYIGGTYQGTSDWLSGQDFGFSYMGTTGYYLTYDSLEYLQVRVSDELEPPNEYRWEPLSSGLTSIEDEYTLNNAVLQSGTCTNGSFDNAYFELDKNVVLLHDRQWSIEWQSEGSWKDTNSGAFLFISSDTKNARNATYLYRRGESELIAFGYRGSSSHLNYGICLSDHGIDGTAAHTYKLENRVNDDGTNMVYLFVDGVELGAMNNYFIAGTNQNAISNWISGKDFVFNYIGNSQFPLVNCSMDYLYVNEGVEKGGTVEFRNWDGTVLSSQEYTYGETVTAPANPTRPSDNTMSYTFAGWDKEVVPCEGDAVYTATYTGTYIDYTVKFLNYNGAVLSTATYHYGDTVIAPAAPTRPADSAMTYYFAGWDKTVVPCNGNAVYTATYSGQYISYTVRFLDHDGTVLSTATYHYGDTVTVPTDPVRAASGGYSYTFAGWDKTVTVCQGNTDYTATYTATVVASIKPKYPSLSFEGEIYYNIYFTVQGMDGVPTEDMGLITWNSPQTSGTIETAGSVIPGAIPYGTDMYIARTNGIPAKNLADSVYFKVYAKLADGSYVYSKMYNYSAKDYALDRLANSTNEATKRLCVAMLNYGAAAQEYFGYRPYSLMNADLTEEQKALVSDYSADMVTPLTGVSTDKAGSFVYQKVGYTRRYASVSFDGAFAVRYYFVTDQVPDNGVTMYYWTLEDCNKLSVLTTANATGKMTMNGTGAGYYDALYEGIAAKDIDKPVYVAGVYESDNVSYPTGVIVYSLGAYCVDRIANGSETMQAFASATVVYGYYAKQYFAS